MIIHDVEQGSPEWFAARLGIPTASEFSKIITATGKASTQATDYCLTLLAEKLLGREVEKWQGNMWTERGKELEQEAADYYELTTGLTLNKVGFVTNDEKTMGCSPDRLVGEDGLLEIKCPAAHTHLKYMLDKKLDASYWPQLQGQLYITGREWVDIISYYPEMKPVIIRVDRDALYLEKMDEHLDGFILEMKSTERELIAKGYF